MSKIVNLLVIGILFFLPAASFAKSYGSRLCALPGYSCIKIAKGDSWRRLWPDSQQRRIVMRVNRINSRLRRGMIIAVPNRLRSITHMDVAPVPYLINSEGKKMILVNLKKHAFGAYDSSGYLVHWGPISGGKGYCPDIGKKCNTPRGKFKVFRKGISSCESTKFPIPEGGAPMPFCMFFSGGYAMHAGTLPGHHASHGCVRMFYEDSEWLNKNFIRVGSCGTKVIVV